MTLSPPRTELERDITEALLRLKLARAERDRQRVKAATEHLDDLLDQWAMV